MLVRCTYIHMLEELSAYVDLMLFFIMLDNKNPHKSYVFCCGCDHW